jgi:hypothetical protein
VVDDLAFVILIILLRENSSFSFAAKLAAAPLNCAEEK